MAWINPLAEEYRRRRFTRPDGDRYLRADAYRFAAPGTPEAKMPGWLDPSATRVRAKEAAEDEARAALAADIDALRASHERVREMLAEVKYELAWRRFQQKYNPDQPRSPKGNPDGGQWVRDAGKDSGHDSLLAKPAALRRGGHHYVARQVYKGRRLSEDTRKVFEEATSGKLEDKRTNVFNSSHRAYNKAVNEQLDRFLTKNSISEEQMTPDHARQFLNEIVTSRDPQIRNFNMRMWMREIFRGGRFRGNE
jgi:hypothetical protein